LDLSCRQGFKSNALLSFSLPYDPTSNKALDANHSHEEGAHLDFNRVQLSKVHSPFPLNDSGGYILPPLRKLPLTLRDKLHFGFKPDFGFFALD
jgi:hypothetical protein